MKKNPPAIGNNGQLSADVAVIINTLSNVQLDGGFKKYRTGFLKHATAELLSSDFFNEAEPDTRRAILDDFAELTEVLDSIDRVMANYPNREIFIKSVSAQVTEHNK